MNITGKADNPKLCRGQSFPEVPFKVSRLVPLGTLNPINVTSLSMVDLAPSTQKQQQNLGLGVFAVKYGVKQQKIMRKTNGEFLWFIAKLVLKFQNFTRVDPSKILHIPCEGLSKDHLKACSPKHLLIKRITSHQKCVKSHQVHLALDTSRGPKIPRRTTCETGEQSS